MISIDKKNKASVDISFHIPLPSFKIQFNRSEDERIENAPLHHDQHLTKGFSKKSGPVLQAEVTETILEPDQSVQAQAARQQASPAEAAKDAAMRVSDKQNSLEQALKKEKQQAQAAHAALKQTSDNRKQDPGDGAEHE